MGRISYAQVTATWDRERPNVEPANFALQVWPGFRGGTFAVDRVIVRHETKGDKVRWRSFAGILDLTKHWTGLDWNTQLPEAFWKRVYENTADHLSVFFRQSIEGAMRVRAFWNPWLLERSDDLGQLGLAPNEQALVREIVATEAVSGELVLTFWGERETAVWFGDSQIVAQLSDSG